MWTLYEKIKSLCTSKGKSVSRMCLDIGISKTTMSNLKNGKTNELTMTNMQKISDYLGVTVADLLEEKEKTTTETSDSLDPRKQELIQNIDKMSDEEFTKLVEIMKIMGIGDK